MRSVVRCPRLGPGTRFRLRLVQRSTSLRRRTQQSISVRVGEGSQTLLWTKHGNHKKQTGRRNVRECGNYRRPSNKHSTRSDTDVQGMRQTMSKSTETVAHNPRIEHTERKSVELPQPKTGQRVQHAAKNNTLHRGHRHNGNDWSGENFAILTFAHLCICSIDLNVGESHSWRAETGWQVCSAGLLSQTLPSVILTSASGHVRSSGSCVGDGRGRSRSTGGLVLTTHNKIQQNKSQQKLRLRSFGRHFETEGPQEAPKVQRNFLDTQNCQGYRINFLDRPKV